MSGTQKKKEDEQQTDAGARQDMGEGIERIQKGIEPSGLRDVVDKFSQDRPD